MTRPNAAGTWSSRDPEQDFGGPDNRWWEGFASLIKPDSSSGRGSKYHRGRVPYLFKSMCVMGDRREEGFIGRGFCVMAFPFVGPRRPPQTVGYADWDRWEDSFACCAGDRVIVGRCSDTDKHTWVPIHTWRLHQADPDDEAEQCLALDWTIDPFTLQPLIIVGGSTGNVHILDCGTGELRRTLIGHGEGISCIAAHPKQFHIFASGSSDASIRIWNIFGADPVSETRDRPRAMRSENYGQARADEGTLLVAVLAGRITGGHEDEVTDLDWHPLHHALASCGMDHALKIWPLPPLPPANLQESRSVAPWTPENRAVIVHSPMFGTSRTTLSCNYGVKWIAVDTLLVYGQRKTVMIQWLGYLRYFDRRQEKWLMPRIDNIQCADWENSSSFRILRKFRTSTGTIAGLRMGYHARFTPTASEEEDVNIVTDHLFVAPRVHEAPRRAQLKATMSLYALGLTPPNKRPRLDTRQRSDVLNREQSPKWLTIERLNGRDHIVLSDSDDEDVNMDRVRKSVVEAQAEAPAVDRHAEPPSSPIDRKPMVHECDHYSDNDAWLSDATDTDDEYDGPPYRWELEMEAGKKMRKYGKDLCDDISMSMTEVDSWMQACAISPRGAKWIVGVGDFESIFVWRRKDVNVQDDDEEEDR